MEPRPGSDASEDAEPSTAADSEPRHCVLLRAGGQMSVLDMTQGLLLKLTQHHFLYCVPACVNSNH